MKLQTQEKHPHFYCDGTGKEYVVLGDMFGPDLLCIKTDVQEAIDEWDERFGQRLAGNEDIFEDYGTTPEERFEKALDDGAIRINSGGTVVIVDECEWFRSFRTIAEAQAAFPDFITPAMLCEIVEDLS